MSSLARIVFRKLNGPVAIFADLSRGKEFCSTETSRNISDVSFVPQNQSYDRPWVEIATTKEDREAFYSGGGFAFRNSTYPVRYVQNAENRALFMREYFRFLFEGDLTSGKAILALLKKWETVAGKRQAKIISGEVMVSKPSFPTGQEVFPMREVDPEATEICLKREKWLQETIHSPMREISASMGTVAWYLSFRATMEEYKGKGYGAKFSYLLLKKTSEVEMARLESQDIGPLKMPPITYLANSDTFPSAFKVLDVMGFEIVGHYHFRYKSGLKCYLDPSVTDQREICCTFLYAFKNVAPLIRNKLKHHSPLTEKRR